MADRAPDRDLAVFRSKRNATAYRILVEIAERQPAVSQREIADAIGITAQAVSEYLGDLVEDGWVRKLGRGRYEVTKEGVDWLIGQTEDLRAFTGYVTEEVIGQVEIETAIATAPISEGQPVTLSMRDGLLRATPGETGGASAVAVTDADADEDVGVTDFEGMLEYDPGTVTIVAVPRVQDGGSGAIETDSLRALAAEHDVLAAAGTEAYAAVRAAELEPDVRFGTRAAVREAARTGLDVLLVVVTTAVPTHTSPLREDNIRYEVIEAGEEEAVTGGA